MKTSAEYINFPGGYVEVTKCSDGSHWAHICLDTERYTDRPAGRITDWRMDCDGVNSCEVKANDLASPNLHHVALKITVK